MLPPGLPRPSMGVARRRNNVYVVILVIDCCEKLLVGGVIQDVVATYQIEFLHDKQEVKRGLQLAKAFIEVASSRRSAEGIIHSEDADLYLPRRAHKGGNLCRFRALGRGCRR